MCLRLRFYLLILLILPLALSAHQRSESYSKYKIEQQEDSYSIDAVFTVQLSVLSRMDRPLVPDWQEILIAEILNGISLGDDCLKKTKPKFLSSRSTGFFRLSWSESCQDQFKEINNNVFFDNEPGHAHISSVTIDGNFYPEKLFTNQSRIWNTKEFNDSNNNESSSILDYFMLGLKHISSGFDHIAFLIGILLLNQKKRLLLLAITGFTIGHSITLSLGVLNMVSPSTSFVESLIGYSILFVALEYIARKTNQVASYTKSLLLLFVFFIIFYSLYGQGSHLIGLIGLGIFSISYLLLINRGKSLNLSIAVTSLFGLIHGFGFSGSLSEIGLPDERLFGALLGFNLGVEAGQILIVILLLTLGVAGSNIKVEYQDKAKMLLAAFLLSLGSFWFIERIF
tara:strand:- start:316 stop:1509 length:1194 start_codon:yes stop_codon:yes gene_type:complete